MILDPSARQEAKPFLVYLFGHDEKAKRAQEVVDGTTFKDERVAIASKAFVMVKADASDYDDTHPFAKYLRGKKLPRVILFDAKGQRVASLEGSVSPSKVFGAMKKVFQRHYKGSLDRIVKGYQKLLTQIDTLASLEKALAEKERHASTKRAKREIEKKRQRLEKDQQRLREKEQEILAFEPRVA